MIDAQKSAARMLLTTLVVLSSWQIANAADGVRGRHSLIHRPQIQPAPVLPSTPPASQPQLLSSPPSPATPSQPVQRKAVKRPMTSASPLAEVSPIAPSNSAPADAPLPTLPFYNPDDVPPEVEMLPPPEPQESPNPDAQ